jgi:serine/threonine protein kinase
MSLAPGSRLGSYDVVSLLGAGGMGEVYRARDTRLGREVAIKVLPHAFTRDQDRVARFEREARVLASLNHPNIAAIYGLEELRGGESSDPPIKALIMELVEGATLADLIAGESKESPLRIDKALQFAQQIAGALEAAHEKGIVHRDLKPANVKVTLDGTVKLLDFGLAKAFTAEVDKDNPDSPTLTAMATHAGVIMGTAAYMSPEQAKGGSIDRRTDIFAFGCLLYEMLTGRRAFEGTSVSEIVARVIEREPDWSVLPATLHPRIDELLRRCLEKDPKKRRRDIGDVRMEIEQVLSGSVQRVMPPAGNPPRHRARLAWVLASVFAIALAVAIARPYFSGPADPPETRADINTPDLPEPTAFEISPDGRRLVFVAFRNDQPQLHLRSLDADRPQPLAGTEGARLPFWSPDGRSVGFFVDGALKRIDLAGEVVQTLVQTEPGMGGTWGPDGMILFAPSQTGGLFRVPDSGGEPVAVTTLSAGQTSHLFPSLLPGGRQFLFWSRGTPDTRGIYLGSFDSAETTRLIDADTNGVYAPGGWLLFGRQGALVARRFDPARHALSSDSVTVAESVAVAPVVTRVAVSVSETGVIAYRMGETRQSRLTWFDRSGQSVGTLGEPDRAGPANVALSRDGERAAVERTVEDKTHIWIIDSVRTTPFTFDVGERFPLWSPDGARVGFSANLKDKRGFSQKASNGAASPEVLYEWTNGVPCDWSPDGRFMLYFAVDPKTGPDFWVLPLDGDRRPFKFLGTPSRELWGQFSPNGRWVAYESDESGRFEIYVRSFPAEGEKATVSTSGGIHPRWSQDGKELFYIAPDGKLMVASVTIQGTTLDAGIPVALFQTRIVGGGSNIPGYRQQYDVAPGGRFLINTAIESDPTPITLLWNWKPRGK